MLQGLQNRMYVHGNGFRKIIKYMPSFALIQVKKDRILKIPYFVLVKLVRPQLPEKNKFFTSLEKFIYKSQLQQRLGRCSFLYVCLTINFMDDKKTMNL